MTEDIKIKSENKMYKITVEADCLGDFYDARAFAGNVCLILQEHLRGRIRVLNISRVTVDYER